MRAAAALAAILSFTPGLGLAGPRVMALDQCADQYVLALSPRRDIAALSTRARNADSYLRAAAIGLPKRRATAESALGAAPDVVVRYWGGDDRLLRDLERRGVRILTIDDATDFAGVAANIRRVAAGLDARPAGERLIGRMNAELAAAGGAGRGRGVYYLTSGGDTAGAGVLVDAMIRAAGFANLDTRPGYGVISLERLLLDPPSLFVLGFFDQDMAAGERWSVGREAALRRLIATRQSVSLPASILGCPAWFAADGAAALAAWARAHPGGG
ncbi:MAG TPA: ABC transporter substrate-binding protein [Caulobacteraceae bacterium]